MTKKKSKKIKQKDIPLQKAIYPLRTGTLVSAVVWNERTFITGKIVKSISEVERFELSEGFTDFTSHEYVIETGNGEKYNVIEDYVFVEAEDFPNFIISEIKSHNAD